MGHAFPALAVAWTAINVLVSLGVVTLLFAMIYQFLPDVDLALRDVWVGALVTAGLFTRRQERDRPLPRHQRAWPRATARRGRWWCS